MDNRKTVSDRADAGITRQDLLKRAATGALLAGSSGWLATYGSSTASAAARVAASRDGKPVRGGTFTAGMLTAGSGETINPGLAGTYPDILRVLNLYDTLFQLSPGVAGTEPWLATSAEASTDGKVWTIHLRDGVVFHNGADFTADDVVWTFKGWSSSKNYVNPYLASLVKFDQVRKRGRLTVEVPLNIPVAQFPTLLTGFNMGVVQNGATLKDVSAADHGTGPFKLGSFTPGQRSVFLANQNYWQEGKPYVDQLICDSSFTDQTARLNALLSGQINVLPLFPYTEVAAQESAKQVQVLRAKAPQAYYYVMRVDKGPFADNRVREAMKLIVDRPATIDAAFSGYGMPANDLVCLDDQYYDASLPQRKQDIEKAKSLLRAAGQSGMTFDFPTSYAVPGFVESVTVFAEQAKAAGVTVNVKVLPSSDYFATTGAYPWLSRPIGTNNLQSFPSLTFGYLELFAPKAYVDESRWGDSQTAATKLMYQAIAATKPGLAQELWTEVQTLQYNEGGMVVWGWADYVDGIALNVRGVTTTPANNLNNFQFQDGWIAT